MNFYKRFIGDYLRDTVHLSMVEHGAYTALLDAYYASEQPLPADAEALYRIAKAVTAVERRAVDIVADQFFPVNGDGRRHNKRADEELFKYGERAEKNRQVGRLGGRPRKRRIDQQNNSSEENRDGSNAETQTVILRGAPKKTQEETETKPTGNPSHSQILTTEVSIDTLAESGNPEKTQTVLPDCPQQQLIALYAKHLPMLTQPRVWDGQRAKDMRARWRQCAQPTDTFPGYRTLEEGLRFWDRFFAVVAQSRVLTEGITTGGRTWTPDLPWLMKAANFAKVIEGRYHE